MPDPEQAATHEQSDLQPRGIVWFAIGLVIVVVLTFAAVRLFEHVLTPEPSTVTRGPLTPSANVPAPRLQADERRDLERLRAAEDEKLRTYGWVDREAGVVRIPIERAMELLIARGVPVRAERKGGKP